jgi:hypothetical protein
MGTGNKQWAMSNELARKRVCRANRQLLIEQFPVVLLFDGRSWRDKSKQLSGPGLKRSIPAPLEYSSCHRMKELLYSWLDYSLACAVTPECFDQRLLHFLACQARHTLS